MLNILTAAQAIGQNWLSGWGYRQSHVINSASGAGTNYQIPINVHLASGTSSGMNVYENGHGLSNFGDVRFTASDGSTLLNYWMQGGGVSSTDTNVTAKLSSASLASNGVLYAGNKTSVLKSTNGGQTWTTLTTFSSNCTAVYVYYTSLGNLLVSPEGNSTLSASTRGIWRSADNGATWTRVLTLNASANAVIWQGWAEDNEHRLFAGEYAESATIGDARIWESTNNGTTWSCVYYDPAARHIHAVAVDPSTDYIYATVGDSMAPWNTNYILKSTNHGTTWTKILTALPQCVAICITPNARLFGSDNSTGDYRIYRTTDDSSYSVVYDSGFNAPGSYVAWIKRDPLTGNMYAGMEAATVHTAYILESQDGGLTWKIYKSFSITANWTGTDSSSYFVNDTLYYTYQTTSPTGMTIWSYGHKLQDPRTISVTNTNMNENFISIWISPSGAIYGGCSNGSVLKSTNGGSTWASVETMANCDEMEVYGTSSNGYVFFSPDCNGSRGLYRSTNNGQTWTEVLPLNEPAQSIVSFSDFTVDNEGRLFVGVYTGSSTVGNARIYMSNNTGTTWYSVYNDSTARHIHSVAVDPTTDYIYATVGDNIPPWNTNYILRSTNHGSTWTKILSGIPQCLAVLCVSGARLLETDYGAAGTIYRTTDDTSYSTVLTTSQPTAEGDWLRQDPTTGRIYGEFGTGTTPSSALIYYSDNNGLTWTLYKTLSASQSDDGCGRASNFVNGTLYYCYRYGATYQLAQKIVDTITTPSYATFWVKDPDNLDSTSSTIYVYYGNTGATTTSNGVNTFNLFDDFLGSSLNTTKWSTYGTGSVSVSNGIASTTANSGGKSYGIMSSSTFGLNTRVIGRAESNITGTDSDSEVGYRNSAGNNVIQACRETDTSDPDFYVETTISGKSTGINTNLARDNNWHVFYVMRTSSSSVTMYVDSSSVSATSTTNIPTGSLSAYAGSWNGGTLAKTYLDWIAVTKYVSSEPTQGIWGSEQTNSMSVSISPSSVVMDVGQSQVFTSSVSGGTSPYTYQWILNGAQAGTLSSYTFTPSSANSYTLYLNVTDQNNYRIKSNVVTITVHTPPSVSILPSGNVTINIGQSETFNSTVSSGTSPYSYQWYLNGATQNGATSTSWIYTPSSTGTYQIYLIVTDSVGQTVQSSTATLTVNTPPITVTVSPSTVSLGLGQSQAFTSSVNGGTPSYTYQWYLDNNPISGATLSTCTCAASGVGAHQLRLNVTDSLGVKASFTATINVWSSAFSVVSNSTVSGLVFNSTSGVLSFAVSGPSGTQGYANVTIAKTLIANVSALSVYLDGNKITYAVSSSNYNWLIHFTYHHSTHKIVINLGQQQAESLPQTQRGIFTLSNGIAIAIIAVAIAVIGAMVKKRRAPEKT